MGEENKDGGIHWLGSLGGGGAVGLEQHSKPERDCTGE